MSGELPPYAQLAANPTIVRVEQDLSPRDANGSGVDAKVEVIPPKLKKPASTASAAADTPVAVAAAGSDMDSSFVEVLSPQPSGSAAAAASSVVVAAGTPAAAFSSTASSTVALSDSLASFASTLTTDALPVADPLFAGRTASEVARITQSIGAPLKLVRKRSASAGENTPELSQIAIAAVPAAVPVAEAPAIPATQPQSPSHPDSKAAAAATPVAASAAAVTPVIATPVVAAAPTPAPAASVTVTPVLATPSAPPADAVGVSTPPPVVDAKSGGDAKSSPAPAAGRPAPSAADAKAQYERDLAFAIAESTGAPLPSGVPASNPALAVAVPTPVPIASAAPPGGALVPRPADRRLSVNPLGIKPHIRDMVMADIDELNLLPGFRAGVFFDEHRGVIRVHALVSPKNFGITSAQMKVWNVDPTRHVCVSLDFGSHYTSGIAPPRRVVSFATRTGDNQNMNVEKFKDQVEYGLAGMVCLRLEKQVLGGKLWPPKLKARPAQMTVQQKEQALKDSIEDKPKKSGDAKDVKSVVADAVSFAAPVAKSGGAAVVSLNDWSNSVAAQQFQSYLKLTGKDAIAALEAKNKPKAVASAGDAKGDGKADVKAGDGKDAKEADVLPVYIAKQLTDPMHIIAFYELCGILGEFSQPLLLYALKQRAWEVGKAVNALLEGASKVKLIEGMNAEFKDSLKPKGSDNPLAAVKGVMKEEVKEKDKLVIQLRELCDGAPIEIIKFALSKYNRNLEKAAAALMDDHSLNKLFSEYDDKCAEADRNKPAGPSMVAVLRRNGVDLEVLSQTNFLIRILNTVEASIVTCGMRCLMCGQALEYPSFKPVICDEKKCSSLYQELGMGFDLLSEIQASGEVVDLLISFACAAVGNGKISFVYPTNINYVTNSGKELSFMKSNGSDHDLPALTATLERIPAISQLKKFANTSELRVFLDKKDQLIYPLLVWLITTNRSYLRLLRPSEKFKDLNCHQFVMVSSSSKREQMFLAAKERQMERSKNGKGSIYMFHGSPIGNWHSILRTGLKVSGGTGLGASGPSIWMANDFSTSHGYSHREGKKGGWKNSQFGPSIICMAILEVVNDKSKGVDGNAAVNIISDVGIICTRYFLVFSDNMPMLKVRAVNLPIRDFEL